MTTITINTTNNNLIEMIKAFVSKDPKGTTISYGDNADEISEADARKLIEISDADDRGELEFYSIDKMREISRNHLRKLGADI